MPAHYNSTLGKPWYQENAAPLTNARTLSIPLCPVIPTLVHQVGWGRPINDVEVDAAVDSTGLAWAVTELVTGVQPPSPLVPDACERIRAAHMLEDWLAEQAQE